VLIVLLDLDFYQSIKLVNYIRASVTDGSSQPDVSSPAKWADDKFLQPVLEDDALLFSLDELTQPDDNGSKPTSSEQQTPESKIAELEAQLSALTSQFADFRQQVDQTLERRWAEPGGDGTIAESSTAVKRHDFDGSYFESYSYNGKCPRSSAL
jgi:protein arginine N-methyltransferase 3